MEHQHAPELVSESGFCAGSQILYIDMDKPSKRQRTRAAKRRRDDEWAANGMPSAAELKELKRARRLASAAAQAPRPGAEAGAAGGAAAAAAEEQAAAAAAAAAGCGF